MLQTFRIINQRIELLIAAAPKSNIGRRIKYIYARLVRSKVTTRSEVSFISATSVAFGAAIIVGTLLTRETGNAAAIWPANGILCAALLVSPRAFARAGMLATCFVVNFCSMYFLLGDVATASLAFAIINPFEAYLTCKLIERFCPAALNFTYGKQLLRFALFAGFVGPIFPSIAGAAVIHSLYGLEYLTVFRTWYCADALGLLIAIPVLFLLADKDEFAYQSRSKTERVSLFAILFVTTALVFWQSSFPLLFLVPTVIVRIAFRLGPSYTAAATTMMSWIALIFTARGYGPATLGAGADLSVRIEVVQVFVLVAFYSALPAANAFADQTRLQRGLDNQIKIRDALSRKLQRSAELLDCAVNSMTMGLCMYDAKGRVLLSNEPFALIYGLSPDQIGPGMTVKEVVELRIAHGIYAGASPEEYLEERLAPVTVDRRLTHHLNDGRSIAIAQRAMPDGGWLTTQEDVTEIRSIEKRIAFLAHHDALTGLANRTLLNERIELALARVRRGDEIAVLFLDLDHFKTVNDTFGHATGDELLKEVTGRLRNAVRETDTLARLGGDEFAVLLVGSEQPTGAGVVANRIVEMVSEPYIIDGKQIRIGTSIGVATAPHDALTTEGLLKCADLALYKAKGEGRGTHRFFESEMDTRMLARQNLERDLRSAADDCAFTLHYQPLLNLTSNEVECFEALIRWDDQVRGSVSPAEFIPLAEETGLIAPIGRWVLMTACKDAAQWPDHIKVAVNLSRTQLMSSGIVGEIARALSESGLRPGRLQLEITETAVMKDTAKAIATLNALRALGIEIAMDDFGTGQSSLSCLRSFPFTKIKIDRSFVSDLTTSNQSRSILKAIVSLANILGMATTAEGIETPEQLDIVRAEGCIEIQGYFYCRPRPITDFAHIVKRHGRVVGDESEQAAVNDSSQAARRTIALALPSAITA